MSIGNGIERAGANRQSVESATAESESKSAFGIGVGIGIGIRIGVGLGVGVGLGSRVGFGIARNGWRGGGLRARGACAMKASQ